MDFLRTDETLRSGNLALLVFLPDAVRSGLVGPIELWVREQTECVPVARDWVSFTEDALDRFYPGIAARFPEGWPLFASLFATGPCLATLWFGAGASTIIPSVKGATHPAHCTGATIRGRFWCDNPSANLVHVSDDGEAAVRELLLLRSSSPDLFAANTATARLPPRGLPPFLDSGPCRPAHSAILTLCSLVAVHLSQRGMGFSPVHVPPNEDARQTMARAEAWLGQVLKSTSPTVGGAVDSYLKATAAWPPFSSALKGAVHVGPWEELILRVGVLSRAEWLEGRAAPVRP